MKMTNAASLHREAMELAEAAIVARLKGDAQLALDLTKEAFRKERDAALSVGDDSALEPTRSVLHRSAASLAVECNELEAKPHFCEELTEWVQEQDRPQRKVRHPFLF